MTWYHRYPSMVVRELARLRKSFAELSLKMREGEFAVVSGVMRVIEDRGYHVNLQVPNDYPEGVPWLLCDPAEIPWDIDRHVLPGTGRACLCVASEYRVHWPRGSDLTDFLERLVVSYYRGQLYYDAHGRWPTDGGRSHGREGILEAYRDLLRPLGIVDDRVIRDVMSLLARRQGPRGHDRCPCGGGRKLRKCHGPIVWRLRGGVDWRHAASDYALAFCREAAGASR